MVVDSSVALVMPTRRPRGGSLSKSAAKAEVGGDGGDLKKEGKWEEGKSVRRDGYDIETRSAAI